MLDVEVVLWQANVGNWASRRVAWACGFRVEGAVRAALEARGQRHDGWIGSLLRADPMAPAPLAEPAVITGDRVRLRPWRDEDEAPGRAGLRDPDCIRWLPACPRRTAREDARAFLLGERTRLADGAAVGLVRGRHRR